MEKEYFEYFVNQDIPTDQQIIDFFAFYKDGLKEVNPKDLQKVQEFLAAKIESQLLEVKNLNESITKLSTEQTNLTTNITKLSAEQTSLNSNITQLLTEQKQLQTNISDLKAEIKSQLQKEKALSEKLDLFDKTLTTFNTTLEGLNLLLQNPTTNLYASDSIKKIIPFKKKTKLFITLNGREQWNAPPTASKLTINGLISSRILTGESIPKYKSAGKWKNVTKYFKPILSNTTGRWCIELDNRKLKDFPLDYWDEFVIRYDDLTTWSGEIIHWSWGTTLPINNQNIQGSANDLKEVVIDIKNILNSLHPA